MKKLISAIAIFILIGFVSDLEAKTDYAKRVGGYFYTSLSPYGTWIEIGFGTPVWRPTNIRRSWSPYYYGQWVYTDYGWYWNSYEPFGHIVYHYGRWYYDEYYGWIWIPDYEWAPAWVEWRYDDYYIGWAPMSPYVSFTISIGLHYSYDYYVPYNHWHFIKYKHFGYKHPYKYFVGSKYKAGVYERTKYRTNYSYYNGKVRNDGVELDRVRQRSGRNIEKRTLVTVNDPVEITRNRNDKEVRTYIAKRDEISRDDFRDVKVERGDRKSSLELSKVEIGRDRTLERTNERNNESTRDRNTDSRENNTINRERVDDQKVNTGSDRNKTRIDEDKRIQERKEVERRNSELEKRNNEQIKRNEEQRKIEERKRSEMERIRSEELKKQNETINRKREESKNNFEVNKQNTQNEIQKRNESRVTEQRNHSNERINRNNEIKRSDNSNRNENRTNTRSDDKKNTTRNR